MQRLKESFFPFSLFISYVVVVRSSGFRGCHKNDESRTIYTNCLLKRLSPPLQTAVHSSSPDESILFNNVTVFITRFYTHATRFTHALRWTSTRKAHVVMVFTYLSTNHALINEHAVTRARTLMPTNITCKQARISRHSSSVYANMYLKSKYPLSWMINQLSKPSLVEVHSIILYLQANWMQYYGRSER